MKRSKAKKLRHWVWVGGGSVPEWVQRMIATGLALRNERRRRAGKDKLR